jgi:hypothetical protein
MAVLGEWQSAIGIAGVLAEHGGATGVAFAWEMQLLAGEPAARLDDGGHDTPRIKTVQPAL